MRTTILFLYLYLQEVLKEHRESLNLFTHLMSRLSEKNEFLLLSEEAKKWTFYVLPLENFS